MNITSTYSSFTVDEAQQCINLLGKEYSDLPYSLHLYGNVDELSYERDHKPDQASDRYNYIIKCFENGSEEYPLGVCVQKSKRIKVFAFFKDPSVMTEDEFIVSKYTIAASLFHEARHAWQNEIGMSNGYTKVDIADLGTERYANDGLEIDANQFQEEQIYNHIHKMLEICKLPKLEEMKKIYKKVSQGGFS